MDVSAGLNVLRHLTQQVCPDQDDKTFILWNCHSIRHWPNEIVKLFYIDLTNKDELNNEVHLRNEDNPKDEDIPMYEEYPKNETTLKMKMTPKMKTASKNGDESKYEDDPRNEVSKCKN